MSEPGKLSIYNAWKVCYILKDNVGEVARECEVDEDLTTAKEEAFKAAQEKAAKIGAQAVTEYVIEKKGQIECTDRNSCLAAGAKFIENFKIVFAPLWEDSRFNIKPDPKVTIVSLNDLVDGKLPITCSIEGKNN